MELVEFGNKLSLDVSESCLRIEAANDFSLKFQMESLPYTVHAFSVCVKKVAELAKNEMRSLSAFSGINSHVALTHLLVLLCQETRGGL